MYVIDTKISKQLYEVRDHITSEYLTWLGGYYNKITPNKRNLAKKAVACFILNSYPKYRIGRNKIGLTLDPASFTNCSVYNGRKTSRKVSYTYTRSLLDFLAEQGYIELEIGGKPNFEFIDNKWLFIDRDSSYALLTNKLNYLFNLKVVGNLQEQRDNVLILRNKKKRSLTFVMTEERSSTKEFLDGYNCFSLDFCVTYNGVRFDVQMYKVYNENFNRGGRSFMQDSIQNLTGEERTKLKIDGQEVCVYDYKGFEPSLCYTMCQEVFEGEDYYSIDSLAEYDDKVLRKLVKYSMLIMFNVKRRCDAIEAINELIANEFDVATLFKDGKIPTRCVPVKIIVEKIEQQHHLILHKFYKGFGMELQNAGSFIADYVTDFMMQNHKCLVLSVFDEFIVQERYRGTLLKVMTEAYTHVLGFSDNCKITCVK